MARALLKGLFEKGLLESSKEASLQNCFGEIRTSYIGLIEVYWH